MTPRTLLLCTLLLCTLACNTSPPSNAQKATTTPAPPQTAPSPPQNPKTTPTTTPPETPEISSPTSQRPPFSPPANQPLSKPLQDLLVGRWQGQRSYGTPSAEHKAADTVAQNMRFVFTPSTLSVSFHNAGTHTAPYTASPSTTDPRTLKLSSERASHIFFHTEELATLTLQSGARILLKRTQPPTP